MKKTLALILALAMMLSLAACGETPATTAASTEVPKTSEELTTEVPATEAPTEPALQVVGTIYVLNDALEDLPTYDDPLEVRSDSDWLRGWNVGAFAEKHFWIMPQDDQKISVIIYRDGNTDSPEGDPGLTYGTFMKQMICTDVSQELQTSEPTGIIFGPDLDGSWLTYDVGAVVCGSEAIVLGKANAWNAEELINGKLGGQDNVIRMVEADSYDFICADGSTEEIAAEDLADIRIFLEETDSRADASAAEDPEHTLKNVQYIVPHGLEKEKLPETVEESAVYKITVFNTAVKGTEPDMICPYGGSVQVGYKTTEVLEKLGLGEYGSVTTISGGDSAPVICSFAEFKERYIVINDSEDRGPYTVGRNQEKDKVTQNVLLFSMDNDAILYVPETYTKEASLSYAEILEKLGVTGVKAINVICFDDFNELIEAADLAGAGLFYNYEHVDTTSIAYPKYTLEKVVRIEILK